MPRKPKFLTDDQIVQLEALAAVLTTEQIADYFRMARSTFMKRLSESKEVRAAYDRGRAWGLAQVGNGLLKNALKGNVAAQIFYLKAQGGWRESPPEGAGAEAPPLQITIQAREAVGNVRITRGADPERPAGDLPE